MSTVALSCRVRQPAVQLEGGTYLTGMLAGGLTRTGMIGFIGGIGLPPVEGTPLGFAGGARAARPDIDSITAGTLRVPRVEFVAHPPAAGRG